MLNNINQLDISDSDFNRTLKTLAASKTVTRKALCILFRASLNDLIRSKSVDKLNQFAHAAGSLPEWPRVQNAVRIFSGGFDVDTRAMKRWRNDETCGIDYHKKQNVYTLRDSADWQAITAKYNDICHMDYDTVTVNARPQGLRLDGVAKALKLLADNPDKWDTAQAPAIAALLMAACPVCAIETPRRCGDFIKPTKTR